MRKLAFLFFITSVFMLSACAEPNPDAPVGGIHALDDSFLAGSVHGPVAKQDLTFCQACHANDDDPPRFIVGIESAGNNGCEGSGSCHDTNLAHPLNWAGANSTFHYSAGNVQGACTLCHGADLDGIGGAPGAPSCLDCHDSTTAFTLNCIACHDYPPDGSIHFGTISGVDHSAVPLGEHEECTTCHGMSESAAGGGFDPTGNYTLFNKTLDTIGDHWDGNIQMNDDTGYSNTNNGCDSAGCHLNDPVHQLPNSSGLTVVLEGYGTAHPLDGSYLTGSVHGPEAKQDLTVCQVCHGQPGGPGSNPAFDRGIMGNGCEDCHGIGLAHPQNWAGPNNTFHYSAGSIQEACTLCHGASLDGSAGPSCLNCHDSATTFTLDCTSCHGYPPDGSNGIEHGGAADQTLHLECTRCHGMSETAAGGGFEPHANYALFEIVTDTIGAHWDSNIQMNGDRGYDEDQWACTNASCHGTDESLSDSGIDVILESFD